MHDKEDKALAKQKIVIYQTPDGNTSIDVKLDGDTVWLTQAQMSELFQKDRTVITRHINNVFAEGELDRHITCAKFAHMGTDGDQMYETTLYNLDVIISVGYRVKSKRGTQFRIWATKILKDYLIKGYAVNNRLRAENYTQLRQRHFFSELFKQKYGLSPAAYKQLTIN